MSWHKPYNISGTIHCDDRIADLLNVAQRLLGTRDVFAIGHYTGATTVCGSCPSALFFSTGFDVQEFHAYVTGDHSDWLDFGEFLEQALQSAGFPYSLIVHDETINERRAACPADEFSPSPASCAAAL